MRRESTKRTARGSRRPVLGNVLSTASLLTVSPHELKRNGRGEDKHVSPPALSHSVFFSALPRTRIERTAWQVGGVEAIAQWQRGVVAIGLRRDPLSESVLIGTGFIVDMAAGIVSTCAHVLLSAFYDNEGPLDPGLSGANGGVAIGVGIGERIQWICRADLCCISQPPARYAQNLCSKCNHPQGPQAPPQQRRYKTQCLQCFHPAHQQKQFLKGPPPSHWPVQESADLGALDLALLQLADVSGQPLSEQTEAMTGEPLLTLWPRCLMDGWTPDLGVEAADHPRGLPIPDGEDRQLVLQSRAPHLADLACALRLGHASTLQDGEPFIMLGYGQSGTGSGADRTSTTTRGHFSGSYASSDTGVWYKTTVTILSGHSGGPVLNRRGEVIGWAVMSDRSIGQLRPVERLLEALTRVLNAVAPGRAGDVTTVRDRLLGYIPESERLDLGDGTTWEAARSFLRKASEAAAQAQASAEQAHHHEQGAYAHALAGASFRDDAARQAEAAQQAAGRSEQNAQQAASAATAATAAADAATNAVRPLTEAAGQAARQAEQSTKLVAVLKAALQGIDMRDLGDTPDEQQLKLAGLLMELKDYTVRADATTAKLQALQAQGFELRLVSAHPSASVLLVIEMPLVLAQAIMELARARDPGLVKLGFRCCQLGDEVVPLGDETSFTKYVQELRDIPVEAADEEIKDGEREQKRQRTGRGNASTPTDPDGKGTFLVTSCSRLMKAGKEFSLDDSLREIQAFRRSATVHENASLSEFREAIRFARAWWYTGYDTGKYGLDSTGLPLFFTEAAKARETSAKGKHVMSVEKDVQDVSMEEISAIVASAVADGKLKVVVLNACRTLKLAEALRSSAGVPFVVCWEGEVADEAAMIFGTALASHVSKGVAYEEAFKRARKAVEAGGKWKLEEPQLEEPQLIEPRLPPAERPWAAGVPRILVREAPHVPLASLGAGALPAGSKRKLDDDALSEGGISSASTQPTQVS